MMRSAEDVEDLRRRNKALILELQRLKQKHSTGTQEWDGTGALEQDSTGAQERDGTGALEQDSTGAQERDGTGTLEQDSTGAQERDSTGAQEQDGTGAEAEEELPVPGRDRGAPLRVTFSDPVPRCVAADLGPDLIRPESLSPDSAEPRSTMRSEERLRPPPLLGYDWIAGVIDVDDSLMERPDEFFSELCSFRALHREQCVTSSDQFLEESDPSLSSRSEVDGAALRDTHQCTFSYRINSRLFPVPLSSQECCPVCKKLKSDHPHTMKDPALVRVSVPCSAILPPHQYRAHRRSSFEPSDSLSLPSHCLSGWSNSTHRSITAPRTLDLRSSLDLKKKNRDLEDLPVFRSSRQKPPPLPQASLLTRHHFLHFPPRKNKHTPL